MLLGSITLKNLLSFKDTTLELRRLNVLIGPNGSGKSNLIDAVGLLQALPRDLNAAVIKGGGAEAWIWKGNRNSSPIASLECQAGEASDSPRYGLRFTSVGGSLRIEEEEFRDFIAGNGKPLTYFLRKAGGANVRTGLDEFKEFDIQGSESVLSRLKSPLDFPPITRLGREFERIRIYKELQSGPTSQARLGISLGGGSKEFLEDGGNNLALVLNEMHYNGSLEAVERQLRRFCERLQGVRVRLDINSVRVYVKEEGLHEPISAARLSDGTLKFLCLLTILLHPNPPSLICIEEPEAGMHPDAVHLIGELLSEASQRTQLIVTTHSETLVDALSDQPEAVVVCEYDESAGTRFERLTRERLEGWLDSYSLGEVWSRGEIGGNRW